MAHFVVPPTARSGRQQTVSNTASDPEQTSLIAFAEYERDTVAEIEPVIDRRLESIEIGDRLFQPTKCLAQSRVNSLEILGIGAVIGQFTHRLVLSAQGIEQRARSTHIFPIKRSGLRSAIRRV